MAAKDIPEHKLKLTEVLDMLAADKVISKAEVEELINERRKTTVVPSCSKQSRTNDTTLARC